MTPSTVSKATDMALNAPSKTGARILQKPSQIFLIAEVISSKEMPRAESRSLIPSTKFDTVVLIFFHVPRIASRKLSFVFQRCTKAATRTAITATTASTGADMPPSAAPNLPRSPVPLDTAIFSLPNPFARLTNPFIALPVVDISLPRMIRNGPIAATIAAILTID